MPSEPTRNRSSAAAVLGQQVLERVAADLPGEPAELRAHVREVLVDQRRQAPGDRVRRPPELEPSEPVEPPRPCRTRPAARPRCRRSGRSRAPASRRRCCRSSRRSCSGCGSTGPGRTAARAAAAARCSVGVHDAGLHGGGARLRVDREHPVEVLQRCRRRCPGRPRCRRSTYRRRAWSPARPAPGQASRIASSSSGCRGRATACGTTR